MPSLSEDDWQYSRITELDLDAFSLAKQVARGTVEPMSAAAQAFADAASDHSAAIRTVNGEIVAIDRRDLPLTVAIDRLSELDAAPINAIAPRTQDAFTHLVDAYASDEIVINVANGVHVAGPIVVIHEVSTTSGDAVVAFPRMQLHAGDDASVSLIEFFCSGDDVALVIPTTNISIGTNANVAYQSVQQLGRKTWQVGAQRSRVGRDATFSSFVTAFGGEYARTAIDTQLVAEGAKSQLLAVYFGDDAQVQDFRTYQEHAAPHTTSELIFKGAVSDHARSVYTGLIKIDHGAVKSNAAQTNRNLVLSEGAHADSVPNLDILENDVSCTHASAVGPIDTEQRFYLESRGIPTEVAEQLILIGFFNDLFDRAPSPSITTYLRDALDARLSMPEVRSAQAGALSEKAGSQ